MSARINNSIYFGGHTSANSAELSPEEIKQDTITQTKISRLLNLSPEIFRAKMLKDKTLADLVCESQEIMNRFSARKVSLK